jgi:hypothetical protein
MTASNVRPSHLFSLFFLALAPATAHAQPLVVAWSAGDVDLETLEARARVAIDAHDAMPSDEACQAFEARSGAAPQPTPPDLLDRWSTLSLQAVRSLAHGDHAAAASELRDVDTISVAYRLDLNRDDARATRVLDACLFDVRARLETHDESAADRAIACRRLAPRVAPSPYVHPPEVLELLAAVHPDVPLYVESTPSGCAVRLDGVRVGQTPLDARDLDAGEHALQVECDDTPGRVHTITLGEATTRVVVDAHLEAVVRTEPILRLAYATDADAADRQDDARALGVLLDASETWLVSIDGEVVRVDAPVATPASAPTAYGRADWEIGAGVGLGALGVGAIVTSAVLVSVGAGYGHLATQPQPMDPDYLTRRAAWSSWEMPALATGWIGGALLTTALPLLLPRDPGVPEWSWWALGAGVAVVGVGIALALAPTTCGNERPTSSCVESNAMVDAGSTLASLGVPLLSVPVAYWLATLTGSTSITPTVSASPTGASIGVEGGW